MPLVVPSLSSNTNKDPQSEWLTKLAGKKLSDKTDETNFATHDLPAKHRVISPGSMVTLDHDKDRMNVHVGEDGIVKRVAFG